MRPKRARRVVDLPGTCEPALGAVGVGISRSRSAQIAEGNQKVSQRLRAVRIGTDSLGQRHSLERAGRQRLEKPGAGGRDDRGRLHHRHIDVEHRQLGGTGGLADIGFAGR